MSFFSRRRMRRRAARSGKRSAQNVQWRLEAEAEQNQARPEPRSPSQERGEHAQDDRARADEEFVEQELASYEQEAKRRSGAAALFGGWRLLPRAARYLRGHRTPAALSLVLTVILALVALAEPWPLAFVVDSVLGEKQAPQWITNLFGNDTGKLIFVAVVGTLLIALVGGGATILNKYIQTKLAGQMNLDFRSELFEHMQRLSFTYHDNSRTGLMMYRMTGTGGAIELFVDFPTIGQSLLTMLGMAWIAYQLDAVLAQLALIVVPLMYLSITYYANRIEPAVVRVRTMEGLSLAIAHEGLAMIRVITSFGRERHEYERFRNQGEAAVDARVRLTLRQTVFQLIVGLITATGMATVLGIGAYQVLRGHISAGELLVIMSYITQVYTPLESLSGFLTRSQQAFIIFQYAIDMLDTPPDVVEKDDAIAMGRAKGELVFEHVTFGYDEARPDVLKDVSFQIEAGEAVAMIGPTGAGKSTLLSLLPRFYDPSDGRVLIDGHDVRDLTLESLRAQFSIVLQEPLLFTGTIRDNIRYGRLEATQEEVIEAARAANAHDFIMGLPDRYKTELGERGAKISGGERQRIAVARAFLRDAPILILDEPTSSIDSKTEGVILDALERLMAGRTTIMIAHRLSTVRQVDRILVLDEGQIVEQGIHEELIEQEGLYRQLWEEQARQRRWKPKRSGPMMLEVNVPERGSAGESGDGTREARRRARRQARGQHRAPARPESPPMIQWTASSNGGRADTAAPDAPSQIRWRHAPAADDVAERRNRKRQARREARREARRRARQSEGQAQSDPRPLRWSGAPTDTTGGTPSAANQAEVPPDPALSGIRGIDHIVVLQDGHAVQHGTHDELIAQDGPYRKIWEEHVRQSLEGRRDQRDSSEEPGTAAPGTRRTKFAVAVEAANGERSPSAGSASIPGDASSHLQLSKIRGRDTVLVMEEAGVRQYGTHDELMAQEGLYRELIGRPSGSRMERQ
jgi:ATP-binding cassette subfamily B protein